MDSAVGVTFGMPRSEPRGRGRLGKCSPQRRDFSPHLRLELRRIRRVSAEQRTGSSLQRNGEGLRNEEQLDEFLLGWRQDQKSVLVHIEGTSSQARAPQNAFRYLQAAKTVGPARRQAQFRAQKRHTWERRHRERSLRQSRPPPPSASPASPPTSLPPSSSPSSTGAWTAAPPRSKTGHSASSRFSCATVSPYSARPSSRSFWSAAWSLERPYQV